MNAQTPRVMLSRNGSTCAPRSATPAQIVLRVLRDRSVLFYEAGFVKGSLAERGHSSIRAAAKGVLSPFGRPIQLLRRLPFSVSSSGLITRTEMPSRRSCSVILCPAEVVSY